MDECSWLTKNSSTLLIFIISSLFLYFIWSRRYVYQCYFKMTGPWPLPILGNSLLFIGSTKDILDSFVKIVQNYRKPNKGLCGLLGHTLAVMVTEAEDLEVVLNSPDALQKSSVYRFLKSVVGEGIFSTYDIPRWKQHRKYIITTFNQKILNSYVQVFTRQADTFCKRLEEHADKDEFDVFPYTWALTLDIIYETVMGYNLQEQIKKTDISEWLEVVSNELYSRIFKPWLYPDFIFTRTKQYGRLQECIVNIRSFAHNIVTEKREEYRSRVKEEFDDGSKYKATLELLVELSEKGEHITDEDIVDESITLAIGGSDSSAIIDSFALMMLGMNHDIQEKVYEELKEVFGESDRPVTVEDLPYLKLLERVIKETMRLFPIGPLIAREATGDIHLRNYTIPKGSQIAILTFYLHRDPTVYEDPLKFDPDRFLPERFSLLHPYAYLPFSGGPRNCIGPKFAMMSMKSVLATVLRKYKIDCKYQSVADIDVQADVMIKAVHGNLIKISRRE